MEIIIYFIVSIMITIIFRNLNGKMPLSLWFAFILCGPFLVAFYTIEKLLIELSKYEI